MQEELLAADLAAALAQAHAGGRYGELLLVADTCQASTLYSRLAAPHVLAVASSKLGAPGRGQRGGRVGRRAQRRWPGASGTTPQRSWNSALAHTLLACPHVPTLSCRPELVRAPAGHCAGAARGGPNDLPPACIPHGPPAAARRGGRRCHQEQRHARGSCLHPQPAAAAGLHFWPAHVFRGPGARRPAPAPPRRPASHALLRGSEQPRGGSKADRRRQGCGCGAAFAGCAARWAGCRRGATGRSGSSGGSGKAAARQRSAAVCAAGGDGWQQRWGRRTASPQPSSGGPGFGHCRNVGGCCTAGSPAYEVNCAL